MVEAVFQLFSKIWTALRARNMTKAAADLPRGEQINQQLDANVAELEKLSAPKVETP